MLSVPCIAQFILQDEFFLLTVENGKVNQIQLRKGLSNKDYFEVLISEVSTQTEVIVQGKSLVKPGQEVEAIQKGE